MSPTEFLLRATDPVMCHGAWSSKTDNVIQLPAFGNQVTPPLPYSHYKCWFSDPAWCILLYPATEP